MDKIALQIVSQTGNLIKNGSAQNSISLFLKSKYPNFLYVRFEIVLNLKNSSYAIHKSDSVWKNINFKLSPKIIGTEYFETLCSIVQTSLGQSRIMFMNSNEEYLDELVGFVDNKQVAEIVKNYILTQCN